MIKSFFTGFGFVIEGRKLTKKVPGLWRWMMIPYLLTIVTLVLGAIWGTGIISGWVTSAMTAVFSDPTGLVYGLLYYILLIFSWMAFIVIYFFFLYIFLSIIASPFYSIIVEKALVHVGAMQDQKLNLSGILKKSIRMFWVSLLRGVILGIIGLILFLLSFIPLLNLVAAYLAFIILAVDSADYTFEAFEMGLNERFQFFREHFFVFAGMGGFVGLVLFVPGLILLVMPSAVVGAASIVAKCKGETHA